ncbi:MAG TPA: triose-phosphate isomerase [Rhizomicrobium sp.]
MQRQAEMGQGMRPLIAGNWKMNGTGDSLAEVTAVARWMSEAAPRADVLVCPPFTLIARATALAAGRIAIGGQDCSPQSSGAFTGDVSAAMLKDAGASAAIVGHSERRRYHGETDSLVGAKAKAAWRAGLLAVICFGETQDERDAGRAEDVVRAQIAGSIPVDMDSSNAAVAYEPVWAIGTGCTPTDDEIAGMHALIRGCLTARFGDTGAQMRILYGGSVKPANAGGILALPNVNGVLVGGASLIADEFLAIIGSAPAL